MFTYFVLIGMALFVGFISFICTVMIWVKTFKNGGVGLGLLSVFCAPVPLILGWVKAKEWNMVKLMTTYTITIALAVVLYTGATVAMLQSPEGQKVIKDSMEQIKQQQQPQGLPAPQ
ncbi:MAG: hypothetical protein ACOYMN_10740 [Roseimicrobium sp.]